MNPFHRENLRAVKYATSSPSGPGEVLLFDNGSKLNVVVQPVSTGNSLVPGGQSENNFTTVQAVPEEALAIDIKESQNVTYFPQGFEFPGIRMKIAGFPAKTPSFWDIKLEPLLKSGSPVRGIPGL